MYQAKQGGNTNAGWLDAESDDAMRLIDPIESSDVRRKYGKNSLTMNATVLFRSYFVDQASHGVVHVLVDVIPDSTTHEMMLPTLEINQASDAILQPFEDVAERLKDTAEVLKLTNAIASAYYESPPRVPAPFIVLENSSGTGKTQMAFNLQATGRCEVFYIVCAKPGDNIDQPVYAAFGSRSLAFRTCMERDTAHLESGSVMDFIH